MLRLDVDLDRERAAVVSNAKALPVNRGWFAFWIRLLAIAVM
jgi:hypothetical protein